MIWNVFLRFGFYWFFQKVEIVYGKIDVDSVDVFVE